MSTEIDARGLACPQPVIQAKKALDSIEQGSVTVIVDNAVAKENVAKLARANRCGLSIEEKDGHFYLRLTKDSGRQTPDGIPAARTVYLIAKNTLGHGNDELGAVLMKSFFFTLQAGDSVPAAVMFINAGVELAVDSSPVLDHLKALSAKGTEIMSCGTCLDYFGLKERLAIGEISNMYDILARLEGAGKAITLS
ncbi:MAG: sulfurtransferase-like selenium metabolism protein YedF [Negativicutes bacterium]|nr:sulfurtransferase-like selenium metabolism protein YedF [Negativicutes bacterium]